MSAAGQLAMASGPDGSRATLPSRMRPGAAQSIGLWVFVGVVTALFSLFLVAYVMRVSATDATAISMPWQLWLSTAWLLTGSAALQRAARLSRQGLPAQGPLLAGGGCALAFISTQIWAWAALQSAQVSLSGNPAGSFFYMLTALHGLHVGGGLVAWALMARAMAQGVEGPALAWRIGLCARYWHFLLALWLALFASFSFITPELAAFICGTPR